MTGQAQAAESMLRSGLVLERLTRYVDKWDWSALSRSSAIDMSHVLAFPDKPWCWYWLSRNPNVTLDHVLAHPDKPWCWGALSSNPNVTLDLVLAHPDKPWCWNALSSNPNVTLDHVLAHPDKPWCWEGISRQPGILDVTAIVRERNAAATTIQRLWLECYYNPSERVCRNRLTRECAQLQLQLLQPRPQGVGQLLGSFRGSRGSHAFK
jgi:hypothetical protein